MNLYKMILVDDEEDVRESIEKKVDWKSLGFQLVGSVSNGEEALELAEQIHVDVVMTDIKMPFMDGLTLCARLKDNYKNTKVVLYSGFDDFELAREAIHLEAEEYLLKPIAAKDIEKVFRKLKDQLDQEFDQRRNLENLREYYKKSLPMMREQLLVGILEGRLAEENAQTMIHTYDMDFFSPYYAVGLLGADFRGMVKNPQESQMLLLSLKKLTVEYLEKHMDVQSVLYLDKIAVIAKLSKPLEIRDFIYHMNQVCKMGSRLLDAGVDAGIGDVYSGISKIALSYEDAKEAFDYRVLLEETCQAIYINDMEPQKGTGFLEEPIGIREIIRNIKLGSKEEVNQAVEEHLRELKSNRISVQQYQMAFIELMTELMKLMRSYQLDMTEIFGQNFDLYHEMGKFNSFEAMELWMKEKCQKIRQFIQKERADSANVMTEKARQYIEEHYADSTLSVDDLCNHLNISATYFSTMFKKEFGMSFISYLTKVRLEHAIELLNNTEDKSYVIAEKVGYTEANYFSYVFKKQYGISPSKYRTAMREQNHEG